VDDNVPESASGREPGAAPNPFVVPPPAPGDAPPSRRATVAKGVRNVLIVFAGIVIGVASLGHFGRSGVAFKDLGAGMCIRRPDGTFTRAHRQDCAKPHDEEIIGWVDDVDTMPVLRGQPTQASRACDSRFEQYSGLTLDVATYHVGFYETHATNAAGHGDVLCFVRRVDGTELTQPLTRSTI
jgi:hypothetical protein